MIEEEHYGDYVIRVYYDDDSPNPIKEYLDIKGWWETQEHLEGVTDLSYILGDNFTMYGENNYELIDEDGSEYDEANFIYRIDQENADVLADGGVVIPLYMDTYRGVDLHSIKFTDDYANLFFQVYRKEAEKHGGYTAIKEQVIWILDDFNKWLKGEVYWYEILDKEGEQVASCGGFYDYTHCLEAAKEMINSLQKKEKTDDAA